MVSPETGGNCGGNSYAPFLLLLHPVHDRFAVVDFTHLIRFAGVIEDALGDRGLTSIYVRYDADIASFLQSFDSRHSHSPVRRFWWVLKTENLFTSSTVFGAQGTMEYWKDGIMRIDKVIGHMTFYRSWESNVPAFHYSNIPSLHSCQTPHLNERS